MGCQCETEAHRAYQFIEHIVSLLISQIVILSVKLYVCDSTLRHCQGWKTIYKMSNRRRYFPPFQATSHSSAVSYKLLGEPREAFYQKLTFVNKSNLKHTDMDTRVKFAIFKRENENGNIECIDVQNAFRRTWSQKTISPFVKQNHFRIISYCSLCGTLFRKATIWRYLK